MNLEQLQKFKDSVAGRDPRNRAMLDQAERELRSAAGLRAPGRLARSQREPDQVPALESRPAPQHRRKRRVVVCIEIVAFKRRQVDDDNICAGAKHLRDCIATSLGVDDGDKRLRWRYACCPTEGREQTLVRISLK